MKIALSVAAILIFISCSREVKVKVINVKDFGVEANTGANTTAGINKIIEGLGDEAVEIRFPKGRYDFYPDSVYLKSYFETNTYDVNPKRLAIFLEKKKNITIDAQSSDFVYHGHIQPFTLDNCENITIKNVNIDWEKPLTAEAKVLEADSKHIKVSIDTFQFPYLVQEKGILFKAENWEASWALSDGSWLIEINANHIIPICTGDSGCVRGNLAEVKYTSPEPGIVVMECNFTKTPAVGNYLIMRHSTRDHAGMFFFHSKNIQLENVNIHHTSGLGILAQYCENLKYTKVNVVPNPQKNRYLSGHDDAFHFMGCRGKILMDSCNTQGLMDDPVNVHGTCVPVIERVNDKTIKCAFAHDMSCGLIWAQKGDSVGFIEKKTMETVSGGIVLNFTLLNKDTMLVEFANPVPDYVGDGYTLENLTWTPDITIRNCYVGSNRARGFLISTPGNVLVENNIFETSGSALLIAGDANYWYESGACKNLTIRNNEFRSACNSSLYQFCRAVITIYPEIPQPDSTKPFHRNIHIENNKFSTADYPILYALSVDNLTFKNNTIARSYDFEPWQLGRYSIELTACLNVEISGNTIDQNILGKNILLRGMKESDLKNKNKEFVVSQLSMSAIELLKN
jgi:hypothetical protein